jgi:hypothetical protein
VERFVRDFVEVEGDGDEQQSLGSPPAVSSKQQALLGQLVARFGLKAATNSSKSGMCSFCFVVQTSNSAYLKEHLVISCPSCPNEVKYVFFKGVSTSKGRNLANKDKKLADLCAVPLSAAAAAAAAGATTPSLALADVAPKVFPASCLL